MRSDVARGDMVVAVFAHCLPPIEPVPPFLSPRWKSEDLVGVGRE